MAKLSEQEFKKEVSQGFKNLYLIYGEEKYLVKNYTDYLVKKVAGKEPNDFDLVRLSSGASVDTINAACEQLPVLSRYKCVVVSDMDIDERSESELKTLLDMCSDIYEDCVLIFTMPTLQKDGKKSKKLQKLAALTAKIGTVLELSKRGDIALESQLVSWAEKQDCILSRINASKIISLCSTDMNTLKNETDKLCAYVCDREKKEITEADIKLLTVKNTEVRIFALSDSVARNDLAGAMRQLDALFEQKERPEVILSVLSSTYVDMYRVRVAVESGRKASDAAKDFDYGKRDFVLKKAESNSRNYQTSTLRKFLDAILDTDAALKSTRAEPRILLETLVERLILIAGEKN